MLAPAAVGTAIGLWGDADQQSTYLPAFAGESPPAAALALLEPRPLFDPAKLETKARSAGDGYVLDGVKSLVPRAADAELFVVAADLEGRGPALFIVEAKEPRRRVRARARDGPARRRHRAPSPCRASSSAPGALLGDADPKTYAECVRLARLGWCALAVGTCQAVLDYVIPYVNERVAFGEPISHRQAVAFDVAEHRDRARGDAPGHATAPRAAPTRGSTTRARSPWPVASPRATACRSAPTASSCSAATAT